MGLLHAFLGAVGLAPARQAHALLERVNAADRRVAELTRAVTEAREEAARWKSRADDLGGRIANAERAAERTARIEREAQQWKARDDKHVAQLADVRERMLRAERAAAFSQEHLIATETKLDVIEAAISVLDRRTRKTP
jgi:predicted  nucleic acid-binding Zn-ribbon protein